MKIFTPIAIALSVALAPPVVFATPPQTPVQIEADQMQSSQKDNSVFFSGKVAAKQEELTIHSDEMTVYYTDKSNTKAAKPPASADPGGNNSKDIARLLAKGHVEITKQGWVATGNQAEYFSKDRKVVLTGNTKVWQNNNLVTGDVFVMYLDEGKSIVESSQKKGERVKAIFYPNSDKK